MTTSANAAMATTYSIELTLNNETLAALNSGGWQLQVFKGVKGNSAAALPTLWSSVTRFSNTIKLSWQVQYGGYVSNQVLQNGITVNVSSQKNVELSDLMTLKPDGSTTISTQGGVPGALAILNSTSTEWIGGMTQSMNGQAPTAFCAFPLYGHTTDIMEPFERVVLVFAQAQVNTGTVVEEAISSSIEITLSGENPTISDISFDINKSWNANGNPAANVHSNPVQLAPMLVVPLS